VRKLAEVRLIHKSDIFFDVLEPMTYNLDLDNEPDDLIHKGEMYIYQKQIYLFNGLNWYKANIDDIKEIKSLTRQKRMLIHFLNYDLLLSCNEYSHLMALRDFLNLYQEVNLIEDDIILSGSETLGGLK
jgi:hypothetical protein